MTTEDLESSYKATASIACNFEMFGQNNENTAQDGLEDSLENNEFGNDNAQKSVFEIGFGSKFLQEMLSNLDSGEVIMELGQPGVGGLIYSAENGERNLNLLMLLMPVML
jgi:DNA polymerase-3 subunit beta